MARSGAKNRAEKVMWAEGIHGAIQRSRESLCVKDGPGCPSSSCQKECAGADAAGHGCHCPDLPGEPLADDCATKPAANPCASSPCLHNATCSSTEGNLSFTCDCPVGYTGTTCENATSGCDPHFCRHGGTCHEGPAGLTCLCTEGYTGARCETDTDECLSNPCLNGALCRDRSSGYSCYCVPGYQGKHCDLEVNECASEPCLNGATCLDMIGKYDCLCPLEYTGVNCELEIDECLSQPCLNGGTCHDSLGGYYCSCPLGFLGDLCAINTDECASQPCLNGGQCVDAVNGFSSACHEEEGQDCTLIIPECRTQNNRLMSRGTRFRLNIRKSFLTVRATMGPMAYRSISLATYHHMRHRESLSVTACLGLS
ncbi:hypothetical protein EYD10_10325 [Varanus komodoensis]|nr:hypothetical protein EYD10_10325 [Varanus komodoensis]